jgi:hypothetical protein
LFESNLYWESEFVDLLPRPFANPKLLALDVRAIPERTASRSTECGPNQIDLAPYCNAIPTGPWFNGPDPDHPTDSPPEDSLSGFPVWAGTGFQEYHGVKFDVRGAIQIEGKLSKENLGPRWIHSYPNAVKGIRIGAKFQRLHLLAGTVGVAEKHAVVGILQLNFEAGEPARLPIRYGDEVAAAEDDSLQSQRLFPTRSLSGEKLGPTEVRYSLNYFQLEDPRPDKIVVSFDYISGMKSSHPYLLAMTIEP